MLGSTYVRNADIANASRPHVSLKVSEACKTKSLRLGEGVRMVAPIFAAVWLIVTASGCIATRGWVRDQMSPISSKLNNTDAKADKALAGLQNLHLERRLVLDSSDGPTFGFGSPALTANAKHEIDGFMGDLQGAPDAGTTSGRIFVVAGHTDSIGSEDYNYELGQRRADRVAGYLVGKEGVDPAQVRVVSYGASKPVADNGTSGGRRSNRRVEILVYQEKIATGS
jgi:outer membrane protein OmpA-like peptidoglycan-associated protein